MRGKILFAICAISAYILAGSVTVAGNVAEEKGMFLLDSKAIFKHYCAPCHGDGGKGDGRYYSTDLDPRPRNLTDVKYMTSRTDEHLFRWISQGSAGAGKSNLCPPWGQTIGREGVDGIISYLRGLSSIRVEKPLDKVISQPKQREAAEKTPASLWVGLGVLSALLTLGAVYQWRRRPL